MIDKLNERRNIIFIVSLALVVVLSILLFITNLNRDFTKLTLRKNKNTIFSVSDLKVDDIKYSDKEKTIIKKYGKASRIKKYSKNSYKYKKLYYDGITLTLREFYKDYILVGANVTKSRYKLSRNLRVRNRIIKVLNSYSIKSSNGTYLYGNYTIKSLKDNSIKDFIFFGARGKKEITYIFRDKVIDNIEPSTSKITFKYINGRVTNVSWIYDYE